MPASSVTRILLIGPSNIYGESDSVNPAKFLERYLNSKASPRRFEVINGGMLGFSTLQSALQMPGLLNAYHPHAVIYDVNLSATLISTWYMHGAVEKGPAGTVTTLKDFNLYWPLPAAAHSWLGRFHTRWITASRFLRVYTRLLSLSASRAFRNGPNPLFNDYKLYLSSMAESCRKQNVKFFVSTVEGTQNFFRQAKIPFWGKPEWVAYHFLPAELVSLPEIETFWKDLPAAFPVLDAREAFRQNAPPQYLGEVSHFDRRGLEIHGEALGRSLLESGF